MYNTANFKQELTKVSEWLAREYSGLHTGRATPLVLDSINVEVYGAYQPIKNIASVTVEDPKTLRIAPWDKSMVKEIEKAITTADVGLSIVSDSDGIRAIFPMLTTETRTRLVKVLKERMEEARIAVRKVREDEIDNIKAAELPEDIDFRAREDMQKLVVEANNALEALFEKKEAEVMQ
jgi:ribosome recycling factor